MTSSEYKELLRWAAVRISWLVMVIVAFSVLRPIDSMDIGRLSRSGLAVHLDNKTGCQYLSTNSGGLMPRMTSHGTHMECKAP